MKTLGLAFLVFALLTISACGRQSVGDAPPKLEHDRVIFQNGRKVSFEDDKTYLQSNLEKIEVAKPVTVIERAFVVEEWKRVIVETKYGYFEDSGVIFRFYDYGGNLLAKTREYFGSYRQLLMPSVDRFILVQKSSHYRLREGYILDPNGSEVGTIEQRPDAYTAYTSKEGDVFMIQYTRYSKEGLFWTVDVLDPEGNVLASSDFKTGGSYVIALGERKIPISLPEPTD